MTPEELAANSAAIQQALTDIGITPEKALLAEGRQKAWARFERAYKAAETNAARRAAIEARVERDATTHMRREMARERGANRPAAPASPLAGDIAVASRGIDWGAPAAGMLPVASAAPQPPILPSPLPPMPSAPTATNALMPQSPQEAEALAEDARAGSFLANVTPFGPAMRASDYLQRGMPLEAAGNAALAVMPFRPALGLAVAGAGYGITGAQTFLPDMFGSAEAQSRGTAQLPGLTPEQQKQYDDTKRRIDRGSFRTGAERRQLEKTLEELRAVSTNYINAQNAAKVEAEKLKAAAEIEAQRARTQQTQTEYADAVNAANRARAEWEAKDTQWKETPIGRFNEAMGGYGPMILGGIFGGMTRSAGRAMGHGDSFMSHYVAPALTGAFAGGTAVNAPQIYNSTQLEVLNPRRRALEEYAAALPSDHPRRAEAEARARVMPELNPIQQEATNQLALWPTVRRTVSGALLEGAPGGVAGSELVRRLGARRTGGTTGSTGGGSGGNPPPPPPIPTLQERRLRPNPNDPKGHWVAPGAPSAAGEVETWVSPAGRNSVTRDAHGYRDHRGRFTTKPPRNYRRISSADDLVLPSDTNALLG